MSVITFLFKRATNLIIIIINDAHSNDLNKSSKILDVESIKRDQFKELIIIKLNNIAVIIRNINLKKSFAKLSHYEFNTIIDSTTITLTRLKIIISSKSSARSS